MKFYLYYLVWSAHSLCISAQQTSQTYDCIPGQPCWPTAAQWEVFNSSIGGQLRKTIPFAAPCFWSHPAHNSTQCAVIAANYTAGRARADVYGSMEAIQYEACGDENCQLLSIAPSAPPILSSCDIGQLSAYYVDARTPEHVSTTLKFVQEHNIRLSIKNTGHDYLGRSVAPNSLALWTHNIKHLRYYESFTGQNCPEANADHVAEMGAGVQAFEAYSFFEQYNMNLCGGNAASVGLAGGFGQGGGHGVFAPMYGLMVDQALEFEVVTADGTFRTINECNDPDLFWALRGGGGGTYAVLLTYRARLYPAKPIHLHVLKVTYSILGEAFTNDSIVRSMLEAHVSNQITWSENNITGRHYYGANQATLLTILPYNDDGSFFKNITADWLAKVSSVRGLTILENAYYTYQKYSGYDAVAQEVAVELSPNGYAANVASRLIPRSLFEEENQQKLVHALLKVMTTPANIPDSARKTSANPVWRDSLWHAIYLGGWVKGFSISMQQDVIHKVYDAAQPIRDLTPGGGSYVNEDSILIEDWEHTFYGDNYSRLLEIKNRYDPTHLFDCFKCVGWRGQQDPGYSCYGPDPSGGTIEI